LKEADHGRTASAAESSASATGDAAVGQLIDFDTDTPPPAPTNAMANLCTLHSAAKLEFRGPSLQKKILGTILSLAEVFPKIILTLS